VGIDLGSLNHTCFGVIQGGPYEYHALIDWTRGTVRHEKGKSHLQTENIISQKALCLSFTSIWLLYILIYQHLRLQSLYNQTHTLNSLSIHQCIVALLPLAAFSVLFRYPL